MSLTKIIANMTKPRSASTEMWRWGEASGGGEVIGNSLTIHAARCARRRLHLTDRGADNANALKNIAAVWVSMGTMEHILRTIELSAGITTAGELVFAFLLTLTMRAGAANILTRAP